MIVVDTNVIAYLLIEGNKTELAQKAFRADSAWIVPSLWRHEFLNILATFVNYGGGTLEDSLNIWRQALAVFSSREHELDMEYALHLAQEHNISAYDAQFVATALELELSLVTEDRKLLHTFPETAQSLSAFHDRNLE